MVQYFTTEAAAVAGGFKEAQADIEKIPVVGQILALPTMAINGLIKAFELKSIRRKRAAADAIQAVQSQVTSQVFQPGV
jgi:hypothetical protein